MSRFAGELGPELVSPGLVEAVGELVRTPRLLVACDFDGVLAPIVDDPSAARPLPSSYESLSLLADLPQTEVALISGRALGDLRRLSGAPAHFHLVGSHGSEFSEGSVTGADADAAERLRRVVGEVRAIAAGQRGVTLEVKPVSVAVHVRNASRPTAAQVVEAVRSGPAALDGVHAVEGKEVIELTVVETSKGTALDALRVRTNASAVFFAGDDVTDERAFARLGAGDVGVKVGPGDTLAQFTVPDPATVSDLLRLMFRGRRTH